MVYLPIKLVGPNGGQITDCYALREDTSIIEWNTNNQMEAAPSQKQYR